MCKVSFSIVLALNIHFNNFLLLRAFLPALRKRIPVVGQKRRAIDALVKLEVAMR
jgi:hypothetical protein